MGLRTLQMILARQARVEGYVPVCPGALPWRDLERRSPGRHVCLLVQSETGRAPRAAVAAHLARASMAGGPPHVCVIASARARAPE